MINLCFKDVGDILAGKTKCFMFNGNVFFPTTCLFPNGSQVVVRIQCKSDNNFIIDDASVLFDELLSNGVFLSRQKLKKINEMAELYGIYYSEKNKNYIIDEVNESQIFSVCCFLANFVQKIASEILSENFTELKNNLSDK